MDVTKLKRAAEYEWIIEPSGGMRVTAILFASEALIAAMDEKVREQICNVASLPGIVRAAYAMPDAHWGYGFPIGGVAAFDASQGGVISAGGVGFDISCGVRNLTTGLKGAEMDKVRVELANALYAIVPVGVGSEGKLRLEDDEMDRMLAGGARWAVDCGYGRPEDLERIEEHGEMRGADPTEVSANAKKRMRRQVGTLGSGNHYLEVQVVTEVFQDEIAKAFGIEQDDVVVSIHCGSRGLGHQIGTEYLKTMALSAAEYGIDLKDRELACAPICSPLGQSYLGAMRAAINTAFANRQVITHLAREVFADVLPSANLRLLYDVSHNTCKVESHEVDGVLQDLYVHRKGATRAWGPGHPDLPPALRAAGQPVLIGGSMGTASYILSGTEKGMSAAFGSACHGAGRAMSRHQALKMHSGRQIIDELRGRGIEIRSPSTRGVAEEAPAAYKDVREVVEVADRADLARVVARLEPIVCVKG